MEGIQKIRSWNAGVDLSCKNYHSPLIMIWEGSEDTPFKKALSGTLLKQTPAPLQSSVVAIL